MASGGWHVTPDILEDYWEDLVRVAEHLEREEIKYFLHCTSLKGKDLITKSKKLIGGYTELPERAPLALNKEMRGLWLAPSPADLPTKSPYGTQRIVMKVRDVMTYLSSPTNEDDYNSDDRWDAPSSGEEDSAKGKKEKKKKEQKKKHRPAKKNQKDCYLQQKMPQKPRLGQLMLFFECAHFYGTTQYVRMVLIRPNDEHAEWCRENLKEVPLHNNPFLEFKCGRMYTYTGVQGYKQIIVELLIVGEIMLDKLPEAPKWDVVGTAPRAGFDPRIGIMK
ncbi:hypothetical protein ACJMK2_005318 [Sinanodonta woodiana]|uniref:Uncharacterized protein n=1 Tax=Sinanodonta woodiana TaxID=1069815 RepID=A0ABD3VPN9_SINWO